MYAPAKELVIEKAKSCMYYRNAMNLSKKVSLFLCALLALIVYGSFSSHAFAQATPLNLTAYPSTFDVTTKPGSSVQERFRIRNNADTTMNLSISLKKLVPDEQGSVTIADFGKNDSYQNWISFDKTTLLARPQEWTDISFTVAVPQDTAFGYYYVIYISPTGQTTNTTGAHAALNGSLAIPVLLTVAKPGAKANLQLVSFSTTQPFYEYMPANFSITFENKGNVLIRPQGNVFVGSGTKDEGILTFNLSNGAVLPGEKRMYSASWDDGFMTQEPIMQDGSIKRDSAGNPVTHLTIHWDHLTSFRIGKYTAHLLAVYNDGTRDVPIEATATFWIFPWKIILGTLVGIILVIMLLRVWLKWYITGQLKKRQTS